MNKFKTFTLSAIAAFMLFSFTTLPVNYSITSPCSVNPTGSPKVAWTKNSHDFGEIPQGTPVSVEFVFTNNGDAPFVISDVVTSCGCTAPDYPKEPIAAGKSSKIKVTYNAANKGVFSKTITVKSNDLETVKELRINGEVK